MAAALRVGLAAALAAWVPCTDGHAYLAYPPMRGGAVGNAHNQYCPQCGNGASVCGDGGQWGSSDFLGSPESPKVTFQAGQIAEFEIRMTAHHKGHFEFSICDQQLTHSTQDADGCLSRHRLHRAAPPSDCMPNDSRGDCQPMDELHPERWYLPPNSGPHKMKFVIPASLQCSACTLQWRWFTANSCAPGADYGCYFNEMRSKGWDADSWCGTYCGTCTSSLIESNASHAIGRGCGEEFRNCADVAVIGSAAPSPSPTPSSTTTAAPTTTGSGPAACVPVFNCGAHSWCDQQGFETYCSSLTSSGCASTFCTTGAPEVEPEPEAEPEPEPEPTSSCHPLAPVYADYCAGQFAQGLCPNSHCELRAVAAVQLRKKRSRQHSFLGLLQVGGKLEHGMERISLEDEL